MSKNPSKVTRRMPDALPKACGKTKAMPSTSSMLISMWLMSRRVRATESEWLSPTTDETNAAGVESAPTGGE